MSTSRLFVLSVATIDFESGDYELRRRAHLLVRGREVPIPIAGCEFVTMPSLNLASDEFFVALKPREEWTKAETQDELVTLMRKEFEDLPGQRITFEQPIEQRINEIVSGVRSDVAVKLFGDDFAVLVPKAREIEAVLQAIPGVADLKVEQ